MTLGDLGRITEELQNLNSGVDGEVYAALNELVESGDTEMWDAMSHVQQKFLFASLINHVLVEPSRAQVSLRSGDELVTAL